MRKGNKGITLIALVITIIVLLILAGITINLTIGDQGIITRAQQATREDAHGKVYERLKLEEENYTIDKTTGVTDESLIEYLQRNGIIDENNVVKVAELFGNGFPTGKGTGTTDVYKVEETTGGIAKLASTEGVKIAAENTSFKEYEVVYYNKNGERDVLGKIRRSSRRNKQRRLHGIYLLLFVWKFDFRGISF